MSVTKGNVVSILKSGNIPDWAYSSVQDILTALKAVDPQTYEHCLRVGKYAGKLSKAAGLNEYEQKIAEFGGILHDVGKMSIEQTIVHKPGRLTAEEYERMMNHPVLSEQIVKPLTTHEFFQQVLPVVRGHHERVDGEGYPDKLSGEEIPVLSRVILIVDTLDAMGQDRAYRKGLPLDVIYKELERFAGTQFDKSLVTIFLESHSSWKDEGHDKETLHRIVLKSA